MEDIIIKVSLVGIAGFVISYISKQSNNWSSKPARKEEGNYIFEIPIVVYHSGVTRIVIAFIICLGLTIQDFEYIRGYVVMWILFGVLPSLIMILYHFNFKTIVNEDFLMQKPLGQKIIKVYWKDIKQVYFEVPSFNGDIDYKESIQDVVILSEGGRIKINSKSSGMSELFELIEKYLGIKSKNIPTGMKKPFQKDVILKYK